MANTCNFTFNEKKYENTNCFANLRQVLKGKAYINIPKNNKAKFSLDQIKEMFDYLKSDIFQISFKEKGKYYDWEAEINMSLPNVDKISTLMVLRYLWEGEFNSYTKYNTDCFYVIPPIFMDIVKTTDICPFEAIQLCHYYLKNYVNYNHTLLTYTPDTPTFYRIKTKKEILSSKETVVNIRWTGPKLEINKKLFFSHLNNKEYKKALNILKES